MADFLDLFLATKPLTTRETEAMRQAAKSKRRSSHFRTAPDGRLVIDADEDENEQQQGHASDDDEDDLNREDLKDLMETLSLSQRAKNKRKRTFDHDDDDEDEEDYQVNDKKSQSLHSKYRGKNKEYHDLDKS